MRLAGGLVTACAVLALLLANVGPAFAGHVSCGDVITQDTTLDSDLTDCPLNGVVIRTDGVRLDLNGHTIDGGVPYLDPFSPFADRGIAIAAEGVTIQNGSVYGFAEGITAGAPAGTPVVIRGITVGCNRVECPQSTDMIGITVSGSGGNVQIEDSTVVNTPNGILLFGSHNHVENSRFHGNVVAARVLGFDNVIRSNRITGSSFTGIQLFGDLAQVNLVELNAVRGGQTGIAVSREASRNTVRRNDVRNAAMGIRSDEESDENLISANHVANASHTGIGVEFTRDDEVMGNIVRHSNHGIRLIGATGVTMVGNRVLRSTANGVALIGLNQVGSTRNLVVDNLVRRSALDGIFVNQFMVDTTVERNTASRNGDDGIDVDSTQTTITRNHADHNRDLGIEAVEGVTDGGGNRARRNGNPLRCTGVVCR